MQTNHRNNEVRSPRLHVIVVFDPIDNGTRSMSKKLKKLNKTLKKN